MLRSTRLRTGAFAPLAVLIAACLACLGTSARAQIGLEPGEVCTVQVLNRATFVAADGTWRLTGVPANAGRVRARLYCVKGARVRTGQSPQLSITAFRDRGVAAIPFGAVAAGPASLTLSLGLESLDTAGATTQLTVTGVLPDGSAADLTQGSAGTGYQSSNPAIATIDGDGLVTAQRSGLVVLTAWNEGVTAAIWLAVGIGGDSDADGLPDDWEVAVGLDPANPLDAGLDGDLDGLDNLAEFAAGTDPGDPDSDRDGLTDGAEVGLGTLPVDPDSDDDLISDGLEVQTGTDPNDPSDYDLAAVVADVVVTPATVELVYNPYLGEAVAQLVVRAILIDGRGIDLTGHAEALVTSDDPSVASPGSTPGQLVAGAQGATVVRVSVAGLEREVAVTVRTFRPRPLGLVEVGCVGRDVALDPTEWRRAVVGCADGTVRAFDLSVATAPAATGSTILPAPVHELDVWAGHAFVAGGGEGLVVVDVAGALPQVAATLAVGGEAVALARDGDRLALAVQPAGVVVVDIADPSAPQLIGTTTLDAPVVAAALSGPLAVAVVDAPGGPGFPYQLRALTADGLAGFAQQASVGAAAPWVVLEGTRAFGDGAFWDLETPGAPVMTAFGGVGFTHRDLAVVGDHALSATVNGNTWVPILTGATPPGSTAVADGLDFSALGAANGVAISAAGPRVVLLGDPIADPGGPSLLFVGFWAAPEAEDDTQPPACAFVEPMDSLVTLAGAEVPVELLASDDLVVDSLNLRLDGAAKGSWVQPPYRRVVTMPIDRLTAELSATVTDFAGRTSGCGPIVIHLEPDVACELGSASCADGDPCTNDVCQVGSGCMYPPRSCDDGDACTVDACDPALPQGCWHAAVGCDDSDACTVDSCDVALGCQHPPLSCGDGNQCSVDSCDASSGCSNDPEPDGTPCGAGGACQGGQCQTVGAGLAGVVTDTHGFPVGGATVTALGPPPAEGITDPAGGFSLETAIEGETLVRVRRDGYGSFLGAATAGAGAPVLAGIAKRCGATTVFPGEDIQLACGVVGVRLQDFAVELPGGQIYEDEAQAEITVLAPTPGELRLVGGLRGGGVAALREVVRAVEVRLTSATGDPLVLSDGASMRITVADYFYSTHPDCPAGVVAEHLDEATGRWAEDEASVLSVADIDFWATCYLEVTVEALGWWSLVRPVAQEREACVTGSVVDGGGSGIAGARVRVVGDAAAGGGRTGLLSDEVVSAADGTFCAPAERGATVRLEARAPVDGAWLWAASVEVAVPEGSEPGLCGGAGGCALVPPLVLAAGCAQGDVVAAEEGLELVGSGGGATATNAAGGYCVPAVAGVEQLIGLPGDPPVAATVAVDAGGQGVGVACGSGGSCGSAPILDPQAGAATTCLRGVVEWLSACGATCGQVVASATRLSPDDPFSELATATIATDGTFCVEGVPRGAVADLFTFLPAGPGEDPTCGTEPEGLSPGQVEGIRTPLTAGTCSGGGCLDVTCKPVKCCASKAIPWGDLQPACSQQ